MRMSMKGFRVYAGCLDTGSEGGQKLRSVANVTVLQVDVTSDESVNMAVMQLNIELAETGTTYNEYQIEWC